MLAAAVAVFAVAGTAVSVGAQWPTGCVELNDIVERHLGNAGSVGIYQRVFGEQAEGACQSDHREDVAGTFAWALAGSIHPASGTEPLTSDAPETTGGWPATCVELNDIVENSLGNDRNVGIYQRTFGEEAETACRQDHADNVRAVFGWAVPCDARHAAVAPAGSIPAGPLPVYQLAPSEPALQMVLVRHPWLACHVYPWLQDGVSGHDFQSLESLMTLADLDESFAMQVASYAWFVDSIDYDREAEWGVIRDLIKIARLSPELLAHVRQLSWMNADHMPDAAWPAFLSLERLASTSVELAISVTTSPWLRDGVSDMESVAIGSLNRLAKRDLNLARKILDSTLTPSVRAIDMYFLNRIERVYEEPHLFHVMTSQPWYKDGLDANERAFIAGIPFFVLEEYFERPDPSYYQSKTISLPLTGEVTVWAFDYRPLPPGENVVEMVTEAARELEGFMGVALPNNSIKVYFTDYEHSYLGNRAWVSPLTNEIGINRHFYPRLDRHDSGDRRMVYHETSHLYFNEMGPYYPVDQLGPNWLDEGGANFMDAYIDAQLGFQSLEDRLHVVETSAREGCQKHGFANILDLTKPEKPGDEEWWLPCMYILGEFMVLNLYYAMGERALGAALGEMYWTGHFIRPFPLLHSGAYPSDHQAYQAFLKHAPPDRKDAVREVYRRIHGGPYIPPDNLGRSRE